MKVNLQLKIWLTTLIAVPIFFFILLRPLARMITIGGQACLFDYFGDGTVAFFCIVAGCTTAGCISSLCCIFLKASSRVTRTANILFLVIITVVLSSNKFKKTEIYGNALGYVRQLCTTSLPAARANDAPYTYSNQSAAIKPYTRVEFTTKKGTLKISAGKGILRKIEFRQHRKSIEVDSIYYPNGYIVDVPPCSKWPGKEDWAGDGGVPLCIYQEFVQDTDSMPDLIRLLKTEVPSGIDTVSTDDGLRLGWDLTEPPVKLNIVVRQYLIRGNKPSNFPGASKGKVKVSKDL